MNNRRKLVLALGAAALGAPDILLAQRVYRIAVFIHSTERTLGARFEALRAGLRELGYIEGKTSAFRYAGTRVAWSASLIWRRNCCAVFTVVSRFEVAN